MKGQYDQLLQILNSHYFKRHQADEIDRKVRFGSISLEAGLELLRQLEKAPIPPSIENPTDRAREPEKKQRVFVVHGHDNHSKEAVARFISTLGFDPVVLHERPNEGKTLIEKFESHSKVDFAVVLFTPDDIGYAKNQPDSPKPRARQNVVLELGFFMGALGRQRVCVLHTGDIELPSDYHGVLYHPFDIGGAWQLKLAKEMKASGMQVDLNAAG